MQIENKLVYTVTEVAALLGVSRPIAYELASRADFPAIRISQKRIIVPA
ncbi:MAG: helix-turn-helix domain-containing protein, partial [Ruthenibacterium sp.]